MDYNQHWNLKGKHALLSPSSPHWLRYSTDKLKDFYRNKKAAALGTELHEHAAKCIELGTKLAKSPKTLNSFVNDAIGYGMIPEQMLYYSEFCFGTADAISFNGRGKKTLRIFDLKTGSGPCTMDQLVVYAALFCLEYNVRPSTINVELRIYQNDDVKIYVPSPEEVQDTMDIIEWNTNVLTEYKKEG